MRSLSSAVRVIAIALTGLTAAAGVVAAPSAHADALTPIGNAVYKDRGNSGCPQMKYNNILEDIAQRRARGKSTAEVSYPGEFVSFHGNGDPQAAAINAAYRDGAGNAIGNCEWTQFGVGFHRDEYNQYDMVGIAFGKPAPPPPPVAQLPTPGPLPSQAPLPTTTGAPPPAEPKPVAAPTVTSKTGLLFVTITITDRSGVASQCTYTSDLGERTFSLAANGSADITLSGFRTFQDRPGTVKCDNGTSSDATVNY